MISVNSFLLLGLSIGLLHTNIWALRKDKLAETAKERCPSQYFSRSVCLKSFGEYAQCEDAEFDLQVCVMRAHQSN